MAAVMTIAASTGRGRSRSRPGAKTSSRAIATAPTSGVSWLRAPAETATGVREALEEMANPWKKPAARLAAPRARRELLVGVDGLAALGGQGLGQHGGVGHR